MNPLTIYKALGLSVIGCGYRFASPDGLSDITLASASPAVIGAAGPNSPVDIAFAAYGVGASGSARWFIVAAACLVSVGAIVWRIRRLGRAGGDPFDAGANPIKLDRRLRRSQARTKAFKGLRDAQLQLAVDPFGADYAHLRFEDRVQMAADLSREVGCVIGVICFSYEGPGAEARSASVTPAEQISRLADVLKPALHKLDGMTITETNVLAVFVCTLKSRNELLERARGLLTAAREHGAASGFSSPGIAMYPVNGYRARDLIKSAMNNRAPVDVAETVDV